jgi:carboxyl-terminal processing protease
LELLIKRDSEREESLMNTLFSKKTCFLFVLVLMLLIPGAYGGRVSAIERSTYKGLRTFSDVLDIVEKNYVEPVEMEKLFDGAIDGMIKTLDPHSLYLTRDMYKELETGTRGTYEGIGTEIEIVKGVLTVVSPIEDTPAYKAGIKPGDLIVKIDGKPTKDIHIMDAIKQLRGPRDSKVTITIMREGLSKPMDFVITRGTIPLRSIKTKLYEGNILHVRLMQFHEKTADDLKKALREAGATAGPLKGIVLDMRNNPGGLLNQSVEVSDAFLKSGVIVSTRGRTKGMESKAEAREDGNEPTCPMVVLVNEGTASAAEIVSGALQDNGRAVIVGMQTFGKGSVQTVIPLEDGAALKLTTAKYYTPKGRSIQAEGIMPDIVIKWIPPAEEKKADEDERLLREKDLKGHIESGQEDAAKAAEATKEKDNLDRDNQLKNAIDILKSWDILQKNMKS